MAARHLQLLGFFALESRSISSSPWSQDLLLLNPCMLVEDGLDHRLTAKTVDSMKMVVAAKKFS